MSRRPRPGEIQPGFKQADDFVRTARLLSLNMSAYAELLASDSSDALREIESPALGTSLQEEWPLVTSFPGAVRANVETSLRDPLRRTVDMEGDMKTINDASLTSSRHSTAQLSEVYGENPRLGFAKDLIGWTAVMGRNSWPIVAGLDLGEKDRVEVSLYKDTREMRDVLDRWVAAPANEDHRPHQWLGHGLVAVGELAEVSYLGKQLPA